MMGYLRACILFSIYAIAVPVVIVNINMILISYYKYLLGYVLFSVLVGCVVCYRYVPVTNPRSIDHIRWTIQVIINIFIEIKIISKRLLIIYVFQLLGLALVTLCSFHVEAMIIVDILSILFYYTKLSLLFE